MPLYEYRCESCEHTFELLVRENTERRCPSCQGTELERQLSVFAVSAGSPKSVAATRLRRRAARAAIQTGLVLVTSENCVPVKSSAFVLTVVLTLSPVALLACQSLCRQQAADASPQTSHCTQHSSDAAFSLRAGVVDCRDLHDAEPATKTSVRDLDVMMTPPVASAALRIQFDNRRIALIPSRAPSRLQPSLTPLRI